MKSGNRKVGGQVNKKLSGHGALGQGLEARK